MKRALVLFQHQIPAAKAAGFEIVSENPDVIFVAPTVTVTPAAFEILKNAFRKLKNRRISQGVLASGRAGRPRLHNYQEIRDAVGRFGSQRRAAKALGIARDTVARAMRCE